ncbi:hypothetical protein BDR04DRAFT_1146096 [Suillus decipiens]|nr:hypothetical protein BDR04DRAFT_1146096 [Suillus decipiens]
MPPARRQRARRSARLKVNTPSYLGAMDEESNNRAHLTPNIPLGQSGPRLMIQWHNDRALTDTLVNYLTTHPADCRILFYSDGKKAMAAADDGPSGSDKGQIYGVLAKLIFTDHVKYGPAYAANAKKFRDAVCNRIGTLRSKYKKIKASFGSTGAGVMPAEGTSAKNLLDAALLELPWYTELDAIWHSNPSMAAKVHSSRPGVDHAGTFYSLVQPHGGVGPSMYCGQRPSPTSDISDPSAHQHGPHALQEHSFAGGMYPPAAAHHPPIPSHPSSPPIPSHPLPPPVPSHSPPYVPDIHLPGLPSDDDDDIANNYGPLHSPLGDALDHVGGNDDDDDMILDDGPRSPSPVVGKKRQLLSSPSPPPSPPVPFIMPSRTPASTYNNRSAFGVQKPSSRGGQRKIAPHWQLEEEKGEVGCVAAGGAGEGRNRELTLRCNVTPRGQTPTLHRQAGSQK